MRIHIEEIPAPNITSILPLAQKANSALTPEILATRLSAMQNHGYHCAGLYYDGELIGISGYWIGVKFYCGKYLELDNVIIDEAHRSKGFGELLVDWLEQHARDINCEMVMLDAYTSNTRAHKFYTQKDYAIIGYHFAKEQF